MMDMKDEGIRPLRLFGLALLGEAILLSLCLWQRWMMLKDVEAVLGSDTEARLCFIYFSNVGSGFLIFLGRMSVDKLSKGVVLGCIHLVAGLMCC